jgi:hypothetical protein
LLRNMLRDEGGGWSLAPHEPSGSGQRISTILPLFKNFFAAAIRAGATSGAENRPAWPSLGRRTKRAEYQSLDAGCRPNSWAMWAESSYGQGDSGCVEERFLCTKSDIFRN